MSNMLIKSNALKDVVQRPEVKERLKEIMGQRAAQFAAALVQVVNQSNQLQKCEPSSVIGAAITAAALDLSIDPNLGEAHIVPYGEKATFQIGYRGLIQLAMRSGEYKSLGSAVVYDGDLQVWDELTGELVIDKSKRKPDAKVIGYAAKFKLINGFERGEYWTSDEIEQHAYQYSKNYRYAKGDKRKEENCLWITKRDEMALKTVEKSLLAHYGPKSIQMRKAIKMDGGAVIDAESEVVAYVDNEDKAIETTKPEFDKPVTVDPVPEHQSTDRHAMVSGIRNSLKTGDVKEKQLMDFLIGIGTIETGKSLDDVADATIIMVHEQIGEIINRIKESK